jgi:ABC-type sugar transport system permease subunit
MDKTINQKAWFLVLPVFLVVAFSAILPLMTVVNYSMQDTFGNNQFFWNGVGWFKELQVFSCGSTYVLPARQFRRKDNHGGEVPFEQRTVNSMLHKLCDRLGDKVRRFTPHDLRSTARSHLSALGVDVIVAERCLNHSLGGLIAVYDQHDYMTERRAALDTWTDFILACEAREEWVVKSQKVIPLRATAA